jgi:hypothetical protein
MNAKTIFVVAIAFVFSSHADRVCAVQIVQTGNFGVQSTNWSDVTTVDKFDGTLGILQSVEMDVSGSITANAGYENLAAVANSITLDAGAIITGTVDAMSIGFSLSIAPNHLGYFNGVPAHDGATDFGGASGELFMGLTGSATDVLYSSAFNPVIEALLLLDFTDANGPVGGLDTLQLAVTASGNSQASDTHGNVASFFQTSAEGEFALKFVYQSSVAGASAPEPTALMMVLFGLLVGGLFRPRARAQRR